MRLIMILSLITMISSAAIADVIECNLSRSEHISIKTNADSVYIVNSIFLQSEKSYRIYKYSYDRDDSIIKLSADAGRSGTFNLDITRVGTAGYVYQGFVEIKLFGALTPGKRAVTCQYYKETPRPASSGSNRPDVR